MAKCKALTGSAVKGLTSEPHDAQTVVKIMLQPLGNKCLFRPVVENLLRILILKLIKCERYNGLY